MINNFEENIGVLDSGVGGLSVLSELVKLMPNKNYIFFGDTKNLPYGTKTKEEIFTFTREIMEYFLTQNVRNIVIACNTTSAVAFEELKDYFKGKLNIFPLIQLASGFAIENLKDGDTIAIFATKATINSKKYNEEIRKINPNINVVGIDCTGLVEIVENRLYEDPKALELIKSKINIAKKYNAKKIVLGCTHYPYLVDIFKRFYDVEYFNPAKCVSKIVKETIETKDSKDPKIRFIVSKNPEEFKLSAKTFFDIKDEVRVLDPSTLEKSKV